MPKVTAPTTVHDDILRRLAAAARDLNKIARSAERDPLKGEIERLDSVIDEIEKAWCGSYAGYHALIYIAGLRPRRPGERFDREWGPSLGLSRTEGNWAEFDFDEVVETTYARARLTEVDRTRVQQTADTAREQFTCSKRSVDALVRALLQSAPDAHLEALHKTAVEQDPGPTASAFAQAMLPNQVVTRDSTAAHGGIHLPPHMHVRATLQYWRSQFLACAHLAGHVSAILEYLRTKFRIDGTTSLRSTARVFVGHGRSPEWLKLKDFLASRLDLDVVAFESAPPAGKTTQQRLDEMKDAADFAFLVFTAEDGQDDGTERARQNVVHEYGVMESKLGRTRAIILHEDDCVLPSNVTNVTDLRFPKGHIEFMFEEVRRVLEREGLL